jgi:paraquat-inducible protein B
MEEPMKRMNWTASILTWAILCIGCTSDLKLKITFDDIDGLKQGDRVVQEGTQIGEVQEIFCNKDGKFELSIEIFPDFKTLVTDKSRFVIVSDPEKKGHGAVDVLRSNGAGTPLKNGAHLKGSNPWEAWGDQAKQKWDQFLDEFNRLPVEAWYRQLQQEMEELAKTLKQSKKEVREKLKREVIPRLEKALEEMKSWLKSQGREKDAEPLERQMKEIKKI